MLKRLVVLGTVGVFLAVPPAIAKSSSTVKSPARSLAQVPTLSHVGQCPKDSGAAADL